MVSRAPLSLLVPFSCASKKLSDADRKTFLDYHNDARRRVAKGEEPNGHDKANMNSAKNMYKLAWDCWLEQKAQELIEDCSNSLHFFSNMTQNILRWQLFSTNPSYFIKLSMDSWWSVGKRYGVFDSQKYESRLYYFANLFAILSLCNGAAYRGKRSAFSCASKRISDADRKMFLDYHNDARRRVAKGEEPNSRGKANMNSAKNMYKLKWDCWLEQKAQELIEDCSSSLHFFSNMTQNILRWQVFSTSTSYFIKLSMDSWWSAGKRCGVSDSQKYERPLYYFANMAYYKVTKLGCAYKVCGNFETSSCMYNANIEDTKDPIWEKGTACRKADECTIYDNSGCEDGLCTVGSETDVTEAPLDTTSITTAETTSTSKTTEEPKTTTEATATTKASEVRTTPVVSESTTPTFSEGPKSTVVSTAETPSASEASEKPEITLQPTEAPTTVVFESTTPTFSEAPESTVVSTAETPSASEASEKPEITSQPTEAPTTPVVSESTTSTFTKSSETTVVPTVETPSASEASEKPEVTTQATEANTAPAIPDSSTATPVVPESTTSTFTEAPETSVVPTVETPSSSESSEEPEVTTQATEATTVSESPRCENSKISASDRNKFLKYHEEFRGRLMIGYEPYRNSYMSLMRNMYKVVLEASKSTVATDATKATTSASEKPETTEASIAAPESTQAPKMTTAEAPSTTKAPVVPESTTRPTTKTPGSDIHALF
ncbi:SCP-like protein [Oesophagostomum dentatum]|uniref:SCP-like protein n=1 Tax=Oesophagostomum dentatum TaxID=61180 RepID=A0A0B1T6X5_OESDE|nr:SCP-like protein [Oesophagostomum dentatum]